MNQDITTKTGTVTKSNIPRVCWEQKKSQKKKRLKNVLESKGTYIGYVKPLKVFPSPSPC